MTFVDLKEKTNEANSLEEVAELLQVVTDTIASGYWHYSSEQYNILHDCKGILENKKRQLRGY